MTRRTQIAAVAVSLTAGLPVSALAAAWPVPSWLERMMGQAPPAMQQHMHSPEMLRMMETPVMQQAMSSPHMSAEMMNSPGMQDGMRGGSMIDGPMSHDSMMGGR